MHTAATWLTALALTITAVPAEDMDKAPTHILVTYGINGGIAAAHVRKRVVILEDADGAVIYVMEQADYSTKATYKEGRLTADELAALVEELSEATLFDLPTHEPAGTADIYGMDTSLRVRIGDRRWENRGAGGCIRMEPSVKPTAAQKAELESNVERVSDLAASVATSTSTRSDYDAAIKAIYQS